MTEVVVLLTGGTVGQRSAAAGSVPDADSTRALVEACRPDGVSLRVVQAMERNSPDITPGDWTELARSVARGLRDGADGVVVLHGTDTMPYTAAALSFALAGAGRPVVLTGSMVPGNDPGSDAAPNLRSAFAVAARSELAEVCVVFSSPDPDTDADILRGNRAVKHKTAGVDAFRSVGTLPLGHVTRGEVHLTGRARVGLATKPFTLRPDFSKDVDLLKVTPLTSPGRLSHCLDQLAAVVIEGTGVGHVHADHLDVLAGFPGPVVVTTQVLHDAERLGSYASDRNLTSLWNVIPAGTMTSATALTKLSWTLGQGLDPYEIITRDVAGELAEVFA